MPHASTLKKALSRAPTGGDLLGDLLAILGRRNHGLDAACMDARGIADAELAEACHRGSMADLAQWTAWADRLAIRLMQQLGSFATPRSR